MPSQKKDAYNILSRPEQVIMVRLRTGNNKWNAHVHTKLMVVPSSTSLFDEED